MTAHGDLVEPPRHPAAPRYRGTWAAPPIPPGDVRRIRDASHLARTVLPGELGELVARELVAWCDVGQTFGGHGRMLAIAEDIETRHQALARGRTAGLGPAETPGKDSAAVRAARQLVAEHPDTVLAAVLAELDATR